MTPLASAVIGAHALVVDHHLDPILGSGIEQAATQADVTLRRWAPGEHLDQLAPPQIVLASLARGTRRLPATVAHLADEVYPGVPVLLFSDEPLVQPYILLHGGRLTVLAPPHDPLLIAERMMAAMRWQPVDAEAGTALVPALKPADTVRRQDLRCGRGLAALVLAGDSEQASINDSLGLTAVLAPRAQPGIAIERDLLPTLDAWHDQPESAQLHRLFGARNAGGWSTLVHLDPEAGHWLLAGPGGWPVRLASRLRLPTWWELTTQPDDAVRTLKAESGDVVLACAPLPDIPECTPAALKIAIDGGALALADHLAVAARRHGCALSAVVLEVR